MPSFKSAAMVIITPEAKLIPASLRHQIEARTAVMTTMIATAANKRIRGATLTPTGEEYDSFARPVGVFMEFVLDLKQLREDFCSRLPERGVYLNGAPQCRNGRRLEDCTSHRTCCEQAVDRQSSD